MILRSELLNRAGFEHGFGTRKASPQDYPADIHILLQVHGDRVVVLYQETEDRRQESGGMKENLEPGTWNQEPGNPDISIQRLPEEPFRFDEGDALITNIPGTLLGIRTADCLPVLIADPATGTAGAIHCGWRSASQELGRKAALVLTRLTGSNPSGFLTAMGPAIGPCHYEVGQEVREEFAKSGQNTDAIFEDRENSLFLDLAAAVKGQLLSVGMEPANMEEIVGCTVCNPEMFWSWRGAADEERMISFIAARS